MTGAGRPAGEAGLSLQDSSPGPPREYPAAATLQRSLDESGAAGSGGHSCCDGCCDG